MNRLWGILVAVFLTSSALAQSVQQSGSVSPGHLPLWITSGVIGDGGTSADSPITSIGATGPICSNSARQASGAWIQLCFQAFANAPGQISIQNFGAAPAQSLQFNLNGTVTTPSFLPSGAIAGDIATFGSGNILQDSGVAAKSGNIIAGGWNGTPVALTYGGTGSNTASGARSNLGLGTVATQNANAVAFTGGSATGFPTPVNPTDVAIKSYVDGLATGLIILPQTTLATAAVLPNTPTYSNGSSGVGATLISSTNSTLTVDGTVAALNAVVLVKNQASTFQNGIYTVTTAGSGSAAWVLTRATYFNQSSNMLAGSYTFVTSGTTNTNSSYVLQSTVTTVGTTAVTFNQFSSSSNAVLSLGGATGAITLGGGLSISGQTLNTSASVDANNLNSQVANYQIATSDCGGTVQAGTGATGLFTITLPTAFTGANAECTVNVKNGDTARGKILSGFPSDLNPILWPLQSLTVKIVNGAWATTSNPGRWKNPSAITVHVDPASGSNTNDGLAATTGAVADPQQAWKNIAYQFDLQGFLPVIAMACSQTHTVQLNMGGPAFGSNLIRLSPDGNCAFTWTNAAPCISIGDLAELDIDLTLNGSSGAVTFACNSANATSSGNIYLHNAVVLDLEGTPIWDPAGVNDNFLFCDGPCVFTIANGITQATATAGNYIINMSEGGKGTQSGTISASGSGGANGIYYLFGRAFLNIGTASGAGWSTLAQSKVFAGSVLVSNGITPAGGLIVGTSGVNCASLTSSC